MTQPVHDPVSRTTYTFEPQGDDLIVHMRLEPGGSLPPHKHPIQEERWSVVEGEAWVQVGKSKQVLTPADGEVVVKPHTRHAIKSTGKADAQMRCHVIPALHLQEFLEESAAAAREGMFMRGGIPRGIKGLRWGAHFLKKHQAETVMLSPPPAAQKLLMRLFARGD
jgi:quercetin dioxygenase-like cupin family protein